MPTPRWGGQEPGLHPDVAVKGCSALGGPPRVPPPFMEPLAPGAAAEAPTKGPVCVWRTRGPLCHGHRVTPGKGPIRPRRGPPPGPGGGVGGTRGSPARPRWPAAGGGCRGSPWVLRLRDNWVVLGRTAEALRGEWDGVSAPPKGHYAPPPAPGNRGVSITPPVLTCGVVDGGAGGVQRVLGSGAGRWVHGHGGEAGLGGRGAGFGVHGERGWGGRGGVAGEWDLRACGRDGVRGCDTPTRGRGQSGCLCPSGGWRGGGAGAISAAPLQCPPAPPSTQIPPSTQVCPPPHPSPSCIPPAPPKSPHPAPYPSSHTLPRIPPPRTPSPASHPPVPPSCTPPAPPPHAPPPTPPTPSCTPLLHPTSS